jgi:hypothetical protein
MAGISSLTARPWLSLQPAKRRRHGLGDKKIAPHELEAMNMSGISDDKLVLFPLPEHRRERPRRHVMRRTVLPDDFQLTQDDMVFAMERGFQDYDEAVEMFGAFVDWHRSKGSLMADWHAAWRTWVRRQVQIDNKPW